MSQPGLEELRQDLEEYEELHKTAKRPRVQETILKEVDRLKKEVKQLEAKAAAHESKAASGTVGYEENIINYAWDQSDKFMKLYLTLTDLNKITDENIVSNFTDKSVTVRIQFPNRVSTLHIARLCEDIIPKESYCKKKSDYVLVMLKKNEVGKTWPWVTEREKKVKEKNKPKLEDNDDPSIGITKLLKNMYDEGDDDMKRTISKAYYESQMKQGRGADPLADF
ncbi:unnamed protein product [Lymnaea stagnalis]|uniref:Calcyclin-binding protein n=1 Tax=Lymnaea stagnalis TaxID=6523 RepID=A0AAV2GZD6_LYMST